MLPTPSASPDQNLEVIHVSLNEMPTTPMSADAASLRDGPDSQEQHLDVDVQIPIVPSFELRKMISETGETCQCLYASEDVGLTTTL